MKTTIEISDPLLRAARQAAHRDGTTLRALVEQGLRLALEELRTATAFRLRDASVAGHGLQPGAEGLSWDALRTLTYGDRTGS
jgi:methyl coenzyme M reductase gamma subunit